MKSIAALNTSKESIIKIASISIFIIASVYSTILFIQHSQIMLYTSLWNDELFTIEFYSSRGLLYSWLNYNEPNNHILFNMINSIWPSAIAFDPCYARLFSLLLLFSSFLFIVLFSYFEKAYAAGALVLLLLATNFAGLDLILQARGYGLMMASSIALTISVRRYIDGHRRFWLAAAVVCAFAGTATVPIFLFFAAPMMVFLFVVCRRPEIVVASLITAFAGIVFYAPTAGQILDAAAGYGSAWGREYADISSIWRTARYLIPSGWIGIFIVFLFCWLMLYALMRSPKEIRSFIFVFTASLVLFFVACLILQTPKIRTTQFIVGGASIAFIAASTGRPGVRILPPTGNIILAIVAIIVMAKNIEKNDYENYRPIEAWLETAQAIQLTSNTFSIHAPFRTWQLATYLDDRFDFDEEFDVKKFGEGDQIMVDSDFRAPDRFKGTDFHPGAVDMKVPQRRGGYQVVSFVPQPSGALFATRVKGTNSADARYMLDGQSKTRWTTGSPQMKLKKPQKIEFDITPTVPCDRFFVYGDNGDIPQNASVFVTKDGKRRVVPSDSISWFEDLVVVDLRDTKPDRITIKARAAPTKHYLSINQAWCEANGSE